VCVGGPSNAGRRGPDDEQEAIVRPLLTVLMADHTEPQPPRCCTDEPVVTKDRRAAAPVRWTRKLRLAVPLFRSAVRLPSDHHVRPGTRVVTSHGQELGVVRDVLVGARGSATYAIRRADPRAVEGPSTTPDGETEAAGHEILIPLDAVRALRRPELAIVDERALAGARRSA
jgi:hypothetical protein